VTSPTSEASKFIRIAQFWLPVVVILGIQFAFSTDSFSLEHTSRYILPVLKLILPYLRIDQLLLLHYAIRKAGHITEYCILGVLLYRALHFDIPNAMTVRILTIVGIAAAALMDEFHQSFVPARTSSIADIGLDCIGGVCAIFLMSVWKFKRTAQQ
jgi:VanZ family protein